MLISRFNFTQYIDKNQKLVGDTLSKTYLSVHCKFDTSTRPA